uniref:ASXL transcriptional regulator 3 n=1 Tax=Callorhinchus milii TaxID=7868 RepID=A0A4W3H481_CALMI
MDFANKSTDQTTATLSVLEKHPNAPMTPKQILQVIQKEGLKEMSGTSPLACLNAMLHTNARVEDGAFCRIPGKMGLYALKVTVFVTSFVLSYTVCPKQMPDGMSSPHSTSSSTSIAQNKLLSSTQQHTKKALKQALKQQQKRRIGVSMMMNKAIPCVVLTPLKVADEHPESPTGSESNNAGEVNGSDKELREELRSTPGLTKATDQQLKRLKRSSSGNLKRTRGEEIDVETPGSILVNTNLRALINKHTFASLPIHFQQQLLLLLPEVDRQMGCDGVMRLSASALNNEFFAYAAQGWKERLAEGEFTPEMQIRIRQEIEKEKKIEQWKEKFFEQYYGEKSGITQEEAVNLASMNDYVGNGDSGSFPEQRILAGPSQAQNDSKHDSKAKPVPYKDLKQTQCTMQQTPAKDPPETVKAEDILISLCSDISSDESAIQEEIAEEIEPNVCENHNDNKSPEANKTDTDHDCPVQPEEVEHEMPTDGSKPILNTQSVPEPEPQSKHAVEPQAATSEISSTSYHLHTPASKASEVSNSVDLPQNDERDLEHGTENEQRTPEQCSLPMCSETAPYGAETVSNSHESSEGKTENTSQQSHASTCSETTKASEKENKDFENQPRVFQQPPEQPPQLCTSSVSSPPPSEARNDSKDLELQKRKPLEARVPEICQEKRPRIENDQSFRTAPCRSQVEPETSAKAQPKVPPIKIQLSRIKLPFVIKSQPSYYVCPRASSNAAMGGGRNTGARTLADIKARAQQARAQREAAAAASAGTGAAGSCADGGTSNTGANGGQTRTLADIKAQTKAKLFAKHQARAQLQQVDVHAYVRQAMSTVGEVQDASVSKNEGLVKEDHAPLTILTCALENTNVPSIADSVTVSHYIDSIAENNAAPCSTNSNVTPSSPDSVATQSSTGSVAATSLTGNIAAPTSAGNIVIPSFAGNDVVPTSAGCVSAPNSSSSVLAQASVGSNAVPCSVDSITLQSTDYVKAVSCVDHISPSSDNANTNLSADFAGNIALPGSVSPVTTSSHGNINISASSGAIAVPNSTVKQQSPHNITVQSYTDGTAMASCAGSAAVPASTDTVARPSCVANIAIPSCANDSSLPHCADSIVPSCITMTRTNSAPTSADNTVIAGAANSVSVARAAYNVYLQYPPESTHPPGYSSSSSGNTSIPSPGDNTNVQSRNEIDSCDNDSCIGETAEPNSVPSADDSSFENNSTPVSANNMVVSSDVTIVLKSAAVPLDLGSPAVTSKMEAGVSPQLLSAPQPSINAKETSNPGEDYTVPRSTTAAGTYSPADLSLNSQPEAFKIENTLNNNETQSQELNNKWVEPNIGNQLEEIDRNSGSKVLTKQDDNSLPTASLGSEGATRLEETTYGARIWSDLTEPHCAVAKTPTNIGAMVISNHSKSCYHVGEEMLRLSDLIGYNRQKQGLNSHKENEGDTLRSGRLGLHINPADSTHINKQPSESVLKLLPEASSDQTGQQSKGLSNIGDSEAKVAEVKEESDKGENSFHPQISAVADSSQTKNSKASFATSQSKTFMSAAVEIQDRVPAPASSNRHLSSVEANNPLVTQLLQGNLPLEKVLPQLRSGARLEINRFPLPSRISAESKVTTAERDVPGNVSYSLSQTPKGHAWGTAGQIQGKARDMQGSKRQAKLIGEQSQSRYEQAKQYTAAGVKMWAQPPLNTDEDQSGERQTLFKQEWISKPFIQHKIAPGLQFKEQKRPLLACGFERTLLNSNDKGNISTAAAPVSQRQHTHPVSVTLRGLAETEGALQTTPQATLGYGTPNTLAFNPRLEGNSPALNSAAQVDTSVDADQESAETVFSNSLEIKQTDGSCRAAQPAQTRSAKYPAALSEREGPSDQKQGAVTVETNKRISLLPATDRCSGIKMERFSVEDGLTSSCAVAVKDVPSDHYETKEQVKVFGPTMDLLLGRIVKDSDFCSHLSSDPSKATSPLAPQKRLQQQLYGNYSTLHFNGTNLKRVTSVIEQSIGSFLGSSGNSTLSTLSNQNNSIPVPKFADSSNGEELELKCSCRLKAMIMCKGCGAFCHDDCIGPSKLCVACLVVR